VRVRSRCGPESGVESTVLNTGDEGDGSVDEENVVIDVY